MNALGDARVPLQISVIVPTFRRPRLLNRCLPPLATQTFDRRAYEVIVADDGPDPATRQIVEDWAQRCGGLPLIRYVAVDGAHGPAAARNTACRVAAAPILAFTDDDTVSSRRWLEEGHRALTRTASVAVVGHVLVPLPEIPTDYERDAAHLDGAEFTTANSFVNKLAWMAAGGFDERFTSAWREDSDLYFSLREQGGTVAEAPKAVVVHPVRPARWGESLRQQRKILFDALLFRKHPALYREKIRRRARWDYYAIVVALVTASAAALAGPGWLAWSAGLIWVALTARFIRQRLRGTSRKPAHVAEMVVTSMAIPPLATYYRLAGAVRFRSLFG